ncbi:hypothetical protein [Candidatus Synchoanobacter obligatus]|uniref:Uncharacterized protein n=1 Tax=Candidatus Synchoanobacter obligatus TaxID=2919597 RepID=A0ABT1L3A6_9GAMM|nr:hypothetical protein [Candidatus Synchoanobacter obligatus]MCP8351715.1 hypothetical protein [Candidatus Synchoanobacter obligatus]
MWNARQLLCPDTQGNDNWNIRVSQYLCQSDKMSEDEFNESRPILDVV